MYDLKDLHKKEIELLQAVHDACEAMNVKYVIMHGTLLGAVRHHGFIPWDDDIDICMTRENYDTFLREGSQYLPSNLMIQHVIFEENCPNYYAKVRDVNTTFLHKEHINLDINQGIFIDVFPIDKIKNGKIRIATEFYKRKWFDLIVNCYNPDYVASIQRTRSKLIGEVLHWFIRKSVFRIRDWRKYILKEDARRRFLHKIGDDCTFISIYRNVTDKFSLFEKRREYDFDGSVFYGPEDYDTILEELYGDYMRIPPKEKQITHDPLFVDLDRGYSKEELAIILNNIP